MPCNTCNETETSNCITPDCSCAVRVGSDCWTYTGDDLECSGIKKDTIGTELIQQLDEFICTKFDEVQNYITIKNIGEGAEVYKGVSLLGEKELRTIVSTDETLLNVVQSTNTIEITAGTPSLELNSESDILSLIVTTIEGANIFSEIDLSEYNYDTFVQSASFNTNTLDLTIVRNNGEPDIVIPLDFLDNHVESAVYDENTITLTLTDTTTVEIDLSNLVSEILTAAADAQVQADILETNPSSKAYINNKNPTKSVTLGAAENYNVLDADNNYVIEVDNGVNDVTITLTGITATDNYFTGFVQKGTGLVQFIGQDITPALLGDTIFGQGHVAAVQIIGGTIYLHGTLQAL